MFLALLVGLKISSALLLLDPSTYSEMKKSLQGLAEAVTVIVPCMLEA